MPAPCDAADNAAHELNKLNESTHAQSPFSLTVP